MDAQYKILTQTAHLVTKESSQEEAKEMFATMSGLKEQLTKVEEYFASYPPGPTLTISASCMPYLLCHRGQILYLLTNHAFVSLCDLVTLSSSNSAMSFKNETLGLIPAIPSVDLEALVAVF